MDNFLIVTAAIIVILLLLVLLGGKRQKWRKIVNFFVEELDENGVPTDPVHLPNPFSGDRKKGQTHSRPHTQQKVPAAPTGTPIRRNPHQAYTEMAILMQKIDDRRRVVDSSGHSTLYDEYFELVFENRKGGTIRLEASRAAFKEVPFNQEGALTYKHGMFIKFKYNGGLISDEYSPTHR